MAFPYLALVDPDEARRRALAERAARTGLRVRRDEARMTVLADPGLPVLDLGDAGLILGDLRVRGRERPIASLGVEACAALRESLGAHLTGAYWGDYVAILAGNAPSETLVVRAPFGGLPCLHVTEGATTAIASTVPLLREVGLLEPRIDWDGIARHLAASEIRRRDTCLSGVREVRGGDRLRISPGRTETDMTWSPWRFSDPDLRLGDPGEAARQVRDAARHCVAARTPGSATALLLLSGGLDSSIVAACLERAGRRFACLTVVTDNPTGDEREQARAVAARVGRPLLERPRRLGNVDLARSAARLSPRPAARGFDQDSDALAHAAAREVGATLVVDGGGGDNVFSSLQSAAPAADCLLAGDPGARFWATAREVGALTGSGLWRVARRAWARARRPHGRRWPSDRRFLTATAIERGEGFDDHPWLRVPPGALPGKAAHVALLAPAQGLAEDGPFGDAPSSRPTLLSQPLVETCLRVPSWLWVERGRNRAVARHAFADDLPPAIAWRRDKGTPDSFVVELFEANRPLLRRLLLDGLLAERAILDRAAVARALDDPRPTTGHDYLRLMQLADVEVWARGW